MKKMEYRSQDERSQILAAQEATGNALAEDYAASDGRRYLFFRDALEQAAYERDEALRELAAADIRIPRALEDVIALLESRGVMSSVDLTQEVRDLLVRKAELRAALSE